jgi:hypothetical protein
LGIDVAFTYTLNNALPGVVSRTHPASILAKTIGTTAGSVSPASFGAPVVFDASGGVRALNATDTAVVSPVGFVVRPFPTTQYVNANVGAAAGFGPGSPPTQGIVDVLRAGYIMGQLNVPSAGASIKAGAPVYVWIAATSGQHIQGGFEVAASTGNTIQLDPTKFFFNGSADANGYIEIAAHI